MASDFDIHSNNHNGDVIIRPLANFAPTLWAHLFSSMVVLDDQTIRRCSEEHDELKAEMRLRLTNGNTSVEEKLAFIDILERLGISYLFKSEIEKELENFFQSSYQMEMNEKPELLTVSLYFRLLRQHGFRISSDIFQNFKDNDGFKSIHCTDAKGLLNLYEAAHTGSNGEDILEEALEFSSTYLTLMIPQLSPSLSKRCVHALEHPFHKSVPRIEARFFISLYEEEEESKHNLVLRLAKLNYTLLQILHRQELAEISRWWKDLISKYPYAKDRSVEVYFWCIGVYFEPEYSLARVMLTKTICVATVIDDTYDAYGTLDEIKIFTEAVRRWDISEVNRLPEYMKHLYITLLQLYASFEEKLQDLGMSYAVLHAKERMIELTQSYYTEAKWFIEGHTPSYEEYLENALLTSGYFMVVTTSLIGIESATIQEFVWLKTNPDILRASATICRIVNDICGYELDPPAQVIQQLATNATPTDAPSKAQTQLFSIEHNENLISHPRSQTADQPSKKGYSAALIHSAPASVEDRQLLEGAIRPIIHDKNSSLLLKHRFLKNMGKSSDSESNKARMEIERPEQRELFVDQDDVGSYYTDDDDEDNTEEQMVFDEDEPPFIQAGRKCRNKVQNSTASRVQTRLNKASKKRYKDFLYY